MKRPQINAFLCSSAHTQSHSNSYILDTNEQLPCDLSDVKISRGIRIFSPIRLIRSSTRLQKWSILYPVFLEAQHLSWLPQAMVSLSLHVSLAAGLSVAQGVVRTCTHTIWWGLNRVWYLSFFTLQFRNQYDNDVTIWSPQVWSHCVCSYHLYVASELKWL